MALTVYADTSLGSVGIYEIATLQAVGGPLTCRIFPPMWQEACAYRSIQSISPGDRASSFIDTRAIQAVKDGKSAAW